MDSGGPRWEIAQEEMAQVIQSLPHKKAPEATGVPNSFLKAMGPQLVAALTLITQACLDMLFGRVRRVLGLKQSARVRAGSGWVGFLGRV